MDRLGLEEDQNRTQGQYLDKTCGSTLPLSMLFLPKSYHVSCSFHISWQHEGSGKAFVHLSILSGCPRIQQRTRLTLCSQRLWSSSEPVLESG